MFTLGFKVLLDLEVCLVQMEKLENEACLELEVPMDLLVSLGGVEHLVPQDLPDYLEEMDYLAQLEELVNFVYWIVHTLGSD